MDIKLTHGRERVSFTGTRSLTAKDYPIVVDVLEALNRDILEYGEPHWITGGAVGVDAFVGQYCYTNFSGRNTVVLPANRKQVDPWWIGKPSVGIIEMPEGTSYKDRNMELVRRGDELVAFCAHSEWHPRSRRSGSWQTVRLARKFGVPTHVYIFND